MSTSGHPNRPLRRPARVDRHTQNLEREVAALRRELGRLKRQIRHNEEIWSGFRQIEIDAIGADSLRALVRGVVTGIESAFAKVQCAAIGCVDLDYEVSRLLDDSASESPLDSCFILLSQEQLAELFPQSLKPVLGKGYAGVKTLLFGPRAPAVASIALSPLVVAGNVIGCLAQGSEDPRHFAAGSSTELLEHLCSTVALCIQNTVNNARLERHGLTDPLTNVGNRRLLERRMQEEVDRCRRYGHDLTCMIVDIDHFKDVNDQFGHAAGDRVLQEVARVLSRDLRSSDILSRYGGEEFVLLLPETSRRRGAAIAERHRSCLSELVIDLDGGTTLSITASIGVASLTADQPDDQAELVDRLLQEADAALYEAKRAGRNRVVLAKR